MADYGHGDTRWFTHDRFGMFIHWGLYSMLARHEWVRNYECISNEEYEKYFELFNPDMFDPKAWAKAAAAAGMKYFVITTKHHEGFCMWDTKYTDYKITNTPYGKDILREVVDAFRAEGIHVGFYYSLLDWHHPDFTLDSLHPMRDRVKPEEFNKGRNMKRYAKYIRDQVTELLTNYGKIDVIWFDFSYPNAKGGKGRKEWESEKLIKLVRKLQPDIIVDNRLDLPGSGDIATPEQYTPDTGITDDEGRPIVWEGCQTFSGSWGYHRDETSWKTPKMCVEMLINHVSRGGNLLMNVGPTSRGYLDPRAMKCLSGYAEWMKYHARAIYGCGQAPAGLPQPEDGRYTYNPKTNRLYLHLFSWPFKHITLKGLGGKVKYAQLLADGSELGFREETLDKSCNMAFSTGSGDITLYFPVICPQVCGEIPVVELVLK